MAASTRSASRIGPTSWPTSARSAGRPLAWIRATTSSPTAQRDPGLGVPEHHRLSFPPGKIRIVLDQQDFGRRVSKRPCMCRTVAAPGAEQGAGLGPIAPLRMRRIHRRRHRILDTLSNIETRRLVENQQQIERRTLGALKIGHVPSKHYRDARFRAAFLNTPRSRVETKMHCVKLLGQRLSARAAQARGPQTQFATRKTALDRHFFGALNLSDNLQVKSADSGDSGAGRGDDAC